MKSIIIGKKSIISKELVKKNKNFKIYSVRDIDIQSKVSRFANKEKKINIIFNNSFPKKLINKKRFNDFLNQSLFIVIEILNNIDKNKVNKIIFSSSSALKINNYQKKLDFQNSSYINSKILAENFIINFCKKNKIKYYIFRIHNLYSLKYSSNSFINYVINSIQKNLKVKVYKNISRDYLNLNDLINIYLIFLKKNFKSSIIDIGSGYKTSNIKLLNILGIDNSKIKIVNKPKFLIKDLISDNKKLLSLIGSYKFKKLDNEILNFFKKNIKF